VSTHQAIIPNEALTVPDRGVTRRFVGFSIWLERVLVAGLVVLFTAAVMVESYHPDVLDQQVSVILAWVFAGAVACVLAVDTRRTRLARTVKYALAALAAANLVRAMFWRLPDSLMMIGIPHVAVRLVVYVGLAGVGFWAWGTWAWFYAAVWLYRGSPHEGGAEPRSKRPGMTALRRLAVLARRVPPIESWPQTAPALKRLFVALGQRKKRPVIDALRGLWRAQCALWLEVASNLWLFLVAVGDEGVARDLGLAALDPIFLYPSKIRTGRLSRLMNATGHRFADGDRPLASTEYDQRRLSGIKTLIVAAALSLMVAGMLELPGCRRETPKGILGGTGNRIAKGKVPVQRKKRQKEQKRKPKKKKTKEQINRESVLKLFKDEMKEMSSESSAFSEASISADAGLPDGEGEGPTAPGSPKGTKIGGKYYMFRIKYKRGNWDANRRGIPALMAEFTKAVNVKTNKTDQAVTLRALPKHREEYFPVLLYITGNGQIRASKREVENLRDYLRAGGFLFADCSGGDFYHHFFALMKRAFPNKRFRTIAHDHTIFRGDYMPWLMRHGCPVYRRHYGAGDARGLFIDGRLAVFYSGGDLGAAWASVGWAKAKRKHVELAFRMGVNIISYAMIYGGEKGLVDEE